MEISSLQKNLVGHWSLSKESYNPATHRFTDKALQNHGTGNGTQLGGSPTFQADHMGQLLRAAPFNGTDDYIDCGNDASLDITDEITLSVWVKFGATQSETFSTIIGKWETALNERAYWLFYRSTAPIGFEFMLSSDGITYNNFCNSAPSAYDVWTHVVATYDGTTMKLYENDILKDSLITSITIHSEPTKEVCIGGRKDAVDRVFDGDISEVRIYNRAINQDERTLLYESYRPKILI